MILNGWKEIASYLRCGVRTVQRWERQGLPVIRPVNGARAHVIAYPQHLDRWLKRSKDGVPVMSHLQVKIEETQRLLFELSQQRRQMRSRINELRTELASLRARRSKAPTGLNRRPSKAS